MWHPSSHRPRLFETISLICDVSEDVPDDVDNDVTLSFLLFHFLILIFEKLWLGATKAIQNNTYFVVWLMEHNCASHSHEATYIQ
jgi:hypothetical protein